MASLNPFRRKQPESLTASASEIDLKDHAAIAAALKRTEKWQEQVYNAYDTTPELHNAIDNLADIMSRVTLYAAEVPSGRNNEPERTDDEKAVEQMDRLGTVVEVSQIAKDFTRQALLPGEMFLCGIQPGERVRDQAARPNDELWRIYSPFEFQPGEPDGVVIKNYKDGVPLHLRESSNDTWIRIWNPHPKVRELANSPLRPMLDTVEELLWWDAAARGRAKSRLNDSGILAIPSNLELPAESEAEKSMSGTKRFMKRFFDTIIKTIQNPGSAAAVAPMIVSYPWNEAGDPGIKHIALDRPQDDLIEARTDRSLRRIAGGFPLPVESFFGLSEANDWTGGTIEESKFRENVEPFVLFFVNALTEAWYRPLLTLAGVDEPTKYLVWYDASNLIAHADMPQAADKGIELGMIKDETWRRTRGFDESDKPSDAELEKRLEWMRALRGKDREEYSRPTHDPSDPQKDPNAQPDNPGEHPPKDMPPAPLRTKGQQIIRSDASVNGNGHLDIGRRLAEIDNDLLLRLRVMADSQVRRAIERGGNKLKSRANKNPSLKASLRGCAAEEVAPTLGREACIALGMTDLFDDAFDSVPHLFASWCDKAIDAALDAADIPLSTKQQASFQLMYSTEEAGQHLVRALKELAAFLIFEMHNHSDDAAAPESDDLLVPASIIRASLAKAGGGTKPNLLLATGHAVNKVLTASGHFASGHRWWYPPSPRQLFKGHAQLDGTTFDISASPHQPGDTEDCRCLAVPVFGP